MSLISKWTEDKPESFDSLCNKISVIKERTEVEEREKNKDVTFKEQGEQRGRNPAEEWLEEEKERKRTGWGATLVKTD